MNYRHVFALCICLSTMICHVGAQERVADVLNDRTLNMKRPVDREKAVARMKTIEDRRLQNAQARGRALGIPLVETLPKGGWRELVDFDAEGPVFRASRNINAAISTGANLTWTSPYSLNGSGLIVGVWDGGMGRPTHQEFATGTRLISIDGSTMSDHAMHVAGIIGALGVNPSSRGMANAAKIHSYTADNDKSEMTAAGATAAGQTATKVYTSNHSYGPSDGWSGNTWSGTGTDQNAYDINFGQYNANSRDIDSLIYSTPYLASFWACGNDGTDNPSNGSTVIINGLSVTYNSAIHPPGDGVYREGFETINAESIGKNIIAIGAVNDAVTSEVRDPSKGTIADFSSTGPADDGRIKPDLVANGVYMLSTGIGSDTEYVYKQGTSMASSNACGSATLLVDQYNRLMGSAMRASTLKALLIHTADDIGRPGPDYFYGWGLINVKKGADIIANHATYPAVQQITESAVSATTTSRSYSFVWDGGSPIAATIAWTDPAASAVSTHDSRTPTLVNDLNLKVIAPNGTEYFPYVMPFVGTWTVASMSQNATTGVNHVDNVEQVRIAAPGQAGVWRAEVSYTGAITNTTQDFGLIISGLMQQPDGIMVQSSNECDFFLAGASTTINWQSAIGGNVKIELLKNGVLNTTLSASTPNNGSFSWLVPANQTLGSNYRIRITSIETPTITGQSVADFTIAPPPIYYASMDIDPGWTLGASWAYGQPTGAGQDAYGSSDPSSGQNGPNVIGYRLDGDYEANISSTRWVTTPVINCSGRQNVKLRFQRWLGVESATNDKAYIQVSNNNTTWTQIWANPTSDTNDTSWTLCEYDISAIANGQATVYIRWGLGTTNGTLQGCGWNLDEVTVYGDFTGGGYGAVITQSGGTTDVTEGGATDTYTVKLATQPTANVRVNITTDTQVTLSPTSLAFTATNWNTAQTVTVTAVDDTLNEFAHTSTINHSATSTDANYNAVAVDGALVNITDNDNIAPVSNAGPDQTAYLINIWSPANLSPIAWFDATDAATITAASGSVSQWSSKAGTSHMLQATGTKQPKTGTNQINGLNAIAFDGVDDALKTATNPFGSYISNAMMMGVFNIGSIAESTLFSLTGSSNNTNRWQSHAPWSSGDLYFDCGEVSGANRISAPSGWTAGQNKLLGYYCSTTDSAQQVWVDGTNLVSDATGHTVSANSGIALGHDGAANNDNCTMGEVVILNGTVSTLNRQKLEGHLAHKWGLQGSLPVDHPYKTQSPTYTSAVANLDGTVSDANGDALTTVWTVVSGPGLVTFGNANAVDTTATFTLPGTYTLRLSASDPGVTTSDDVVITVSATSGYVVSYNGNGSTGGTAPNSHVKSTGVNLTLATNSGTLVKNGYAYAGWNTAANGTGADYAAGATYSTNANLALFAKWTPNTYTVTFNANGGSAPSLSSKSVTFNAAYGALATTSRTNYTFNGWFTAASGGTLVTNLTSVSTAANHTLYAQWVGNPYTVTFDANGGIAASPTSKTVNLSAAYGTLATTSRTGYAFNGWFTAASGGTQVTEVTSVSTAANHTLYAQWSIATYAVTYDGNGNTGGISPSNKIKSYDVAITLSGVGTLTRAGCTFTGWNTAANGSGTSYYPGDAYTANAALELYAQWYAAPLVNAGTDQLLSLSGGAWSPADAGPLAWYDATDSATITQVGGAVSQWADKIGTAHMAQNTSSQQPLSGIVGNRINGLNSIAFDGIDDALKTASNPFGYSISNAMLMGVFNIGTINTGTTLFSLSSSDTSRWMSHAPWTDGNLYFDCGGSSGANRVSKASGWSASQNKLLGYYCSTTDNVQQVWVDGTNFVSDASGHTATTAGGIALGHDGTSSYDNCRMGEVVVINGTVSASNREKLEGYLAHKWGLAGRLPAAHPYKSLPPSNIAAVAILTGTVSDPSGDPLTTAWTVVSGPGSVTFGNANAAATTATFTVAGTYTLRLTASDPASTTTDDIEITVNPTNSTLDHFAISSINGTKTVGTPIPGIAITAQDASNNTVTGFTGAVAFGGTAGATGISARFTAGVLSGISVTPTAAGSNLTLTVTDGTHTGATTITTIKTPYEVWAADAAFDTDANGDGIKNGLAWLLGATHPSGSMQGKLPVASRNGNNLRLIFRCLKSTKRAGAQLKIQSSDDLGILDAWTSHETPVTDIDVTVNGVTFNTTDDGDYVNVIVDIPSTAAKHFARLSAVATP